MRPQIKIATCSYCGIRTVLKLEARGGHELSCGSCGAPLHEMKWLKSPIPREPKSEPERRPTAAPHFHSRKDKRRKKREPLWKRALEEVWDEIEDIFD